MGVFGGRDFTEAIPDECLSLIFHNLGEQRNANSLVCKRWCRIEGHSLARLRLDARALIRPFLARFDSVETLTLVQSPLRKRRRGRGGIEDEGLLAIARRRRLSCVELYGCVGISDERIEAFARDANVAAKLRKFSSDASAWGEKGVCALLARCRALEELSVRGTAKGLHKPLEPASAAEMIAAAGAAASSQALRSLRLENLRDGHRLKPIILGFLRNPKAASLEVLHCSGDWRGLIDRISNNNAWLVESLKAVVMKSEKVTFILTMRLRSVVLILKNSHNWPKIAIGW